MKTGIKQLDNVISKTGLQTMVGTEDAFQRVTLLQSQDPRATTMKLPWCFYRLIMALPEGQQVRLHECFIPYRKCRLASFLVDEAGEIIEQVFYQRDSRYVSACKKLHQRLCALWRQQDEPAHAA